MNVDVKLQPFIDDTKGMGTAQVVMREYLLKKDARVVVVLLDFLKTFQKPSAGNAKLAALAYAVEFQVSL